MGRRASFAHMFTQVPKRTHLVIATIVVGIMTNYMGRKTIRKMQNANLAANMEKYRGDPPNWSCFYHAKQYREECSDYNILMGGDYIERICTNLEAKMRDCQKMLAKEIEGCRPYAMDAAIEVDNSQPWLVKSTGSGAA
ncbi:hypothetical protein, conserved [Babesia bigemina]|uniref:Uncharacterized protein n=1 Tax=Babesia bigemina TaxID=5866 RepID=A0A061DAP5_BABBI|nr:hypothetical protein, conserved [Babesia bigemina]CDR97756.1 hypothetical protein, conserved [Babesia bigemina]|eukprot:XP_012769942.1 hypothetical protein, conserved [Babesia bigemina]